MSVKAWNDEQEAELIKMYTEEGIKDVYALASHFAKGYRSVISKLVQLKIYEKPEVNDELSASFNCTTFPTGRSVDGSVVNLRVFSPAV